MVTKSFDRWRRNDNNNNNNNNNINKTNNNVSKDKRSVTKKLSQSLSVIFSRDSESKNID